MHSIFFGGGTPSLFCAGGDRPPAGRRPRAPAAATPGSEITLEANPGTFERDVSQTSAPPASTRLSIGVQSFDDAHLKALGRVHDAAQAHARGRERPSAFDNFNLDLMYALPGPDAGDGCGADVRTALSFAPPHLSLYHLTLEPNTGSRSHPPALPPTTTRPATCRTRITERLRRPGYAHYESLGVRAAGHALPAQPQLLAVRRLPRHRRRRAQQAELSAPHRAAGHAFASRAVHGQGAGRRTRWRRNTEVARADLPFEFMLNALRLTEGFALALFGERTGPAADIAHRARRWTRPSAGG